MRYAAACGAAPTWWGQGRLIVVPLEVRRFELLQPDVPDGQFQVALDDTPVCLIGPKPLVWRIDGRFKPFGESFSYREIRGFNTLAAMEVVQEFRQLPLCISLATLHGEPLLYTFLLPRIG